MNSISMWSIRNFVCFYFFCILYKSAVCINPIILSTKEIDKYIGKYVEILKDSSLHMNIDDVKNSKNFTLSNQYVPSFGFTKSTIWVKFQITNTLAEQHFLLELNAPLIDEAELYTPNINGTFTAVTIGQNKPYYSRKYDNTAYIFDLNIEQGNSKTYFIKIKSSDQIEIPLKITTPLLAISENTTHHFMFGIYSGIMLIMIFYNLFIYFSIRDKSYLYYVIYILSVMLTQVTFHGYTFKYLWPNNPKFEIQSILFLSIFVGFASVQFLRIFLNTTKYVPKLDKLFFIAFVLYLIAALLSLLGLYKQSWQLILVIVSPLSLFMLFTGFKIARMGYRPAKFFTIAWSFFLVGVFIHAMKSSGILPYNSFTLYTMTIGSAIETVLLSFALADRINIFKKEKEQSQATALLALRENEKLITEQNTILEQKVRERTMELNDTNQELNHTLSNLKDAQVQLVNAEKMASLGQLTAGIAHEINNPINFVSSSIMPLKLDIKDLLELMRQYEMIPLHEFSKSKFEEIEKFRKEIDIEYLKKEMESLLSGIEEGAKRTAEIVAGLKNFSRLDESDVKEVDINEGIQSTLVLLRNTVPTNTEVITQLGSIPLIECLPGKLNQVFMNLFSNAIYAIKYKTTNDTNKLIITSFVNNDQVCVLVEDTGIGMTPEIKEKIFDPFFTTKEVGEGTGLGMSIVFKIIESHGAKIQVESEYGIGTKILLVLNQKITNIQIK